MKALPGEYRVRDVASAARFVVGRAESRVGVWTIARTTPDFGLRMAARFTGAEVLELALSRDGRPLPAPEDLDAVRRALPLSMEITDRREVPAKRALVLTLQTTQEALL